LNLGDKGDAGLGGAPGTEGTPGPDVTSRCCDEREIQVLALHDRDFRVEMGTQARQDARVNLVKWSVPMASKVAVERQVNMVLKATMVMLANRVTTDAKGMLLIAMRREHTLLFFFFSTCSYNGAPGSSGPRVW
jgi:hypothetical protein